MGKVILEGLGLEEALVRIVHAHHERYDGSGYPDGLAGEAIPLGARILAIVDTVEAMTFPRPYREALTYDDVVEEVSRRNAAKFDPAIVRAFLAVPPTAPFPGIGARILIRSAQVARAMSASSWAIRETRSPVEG